MQGPFRGVAGSLARAFGGTVTLHPETPQARYELHGVCQIDSTGIKTPMRVWAA